MKKLIIITFVIISMTACKEQESRYTQASPEIENSKALIKDYNSKNYESLVSHYADTANIYFNTKSNVLKPKNLAKYHQQNDVNYSERGFLKEGQEYEMVKTDDGRTWVNFWGTWQGILKATGEKHELLVHMTTQYKNGKVVESHGYWDSASIVNALRDYEESRKNEEGYVSNSEIIKDIYTNFASGNAEAVLATLDSNIEWNEAENFIYADKNPYKGRTAIAEGVFSRLGSEWEYFKITDMKITEMDNNMVLMTGRYNAKNKTTGKLLNSQAAHVWTLKNGKVTRFQQFTDTKQAAEVVK